MELIYSVVAFFTTGGPFMYPILIVFAVGAAFAVERYITLTLVRTKNQSAWARVQPALLNGDFEEAREMTSEAAPALVIAGTPKRLWRAGRLATTAAPNRK